MYNILVVDDERIHREGLIMLLEKICPDDMLWEASNGQEAMEIMNNISCEIVISDIRMAEMDGLQLQKKVKTDYPETAFVIVSGYADFSYAREALQFHASDYLLKPVDAEELKRAIKKIKKSKNQDQVQKQKVDQMERRLKESAYGYMEWLLNQYIHHTRRKVWEPLSEMFPLRQEGYLMLIRINKQHLILNEEMKREIGYFIKKHLRDTSSITFQVNGTENLLAVLALSGSRIEQEQITQIEEFIQNILVLEKNRIYFAVSSLYTDMESCGNKAYEEAMAAMKYSFYEEERYLQAEKYLSDEKQEDSVGSEAILNSIKEGNLEKSEAIFEKITEVLSEHKSVQPDIFKRKIVFFFFRILRYMEPYLKAEHLSELNALDNCLIESQWYSELKKRSAELIKNIIAFREIADSQETDPLDESRRYIEEHYQDEISLEQIAALYHFNASYFSTLFKQRFGISFSEYLSDIRMEKAENLLKTSSDKVRKIALEVGYKDPNYFNRAFKKRHNMTPEEFRKRVG